MRLPVELSAASPPVRDAIRTLLMAPKTTEVVQLAAQSLTDGQKAQVLSNIGAAQAAATTTALNLKAPIDNAALTGTPSAPTAAPGTHTTQLATTAFVAAAGEAVSAALTGTGAPTFDAGTQQVTIATAVGTITRAGNIAVTVTDGGSFSTGRTLQVPVTLGALPSAWGGLVRAAIAADPLLSSVYGVDGALTFIHIVRLPDSEGRAFANDTAFDLHITNGTTLGVSNSHSVGSTSGVAGFGVVARFVGQAYFDTSFSPSRRWECYGPSLSSSWVASTLPPIVSAYPPVDGNYFVAWNPEDLLTTGIITISPRLDLGVTVASLKVQFADSVMNTVTSVGTDVTITLGTKCGVLLTGAAHKNGGAAVNMYTDLTYQGMVDGKVSYGSNWDPAASNSMYVHWNTASAQWRIDLENGSGSSGGRWVSSEAVASPDLVTNWTAVSPATETDLMVQIAGVRYSTVYALLGGSSILNATMDGDSESYLSELSDFAKVSTPVGSVGQVNQDWIAGGADVYKCVSETPLYMWVKLN